MEKDNSDDKNRICSACDKEIQLGEDVVTVERGVMGPRGLVPLQDAEFFCSERCLVEDLSGGLIERKTLPRRVP